MSSSVFDDASSYAPGVSTGMPVDADAFLANFANKKGRVRKKDIKDYREGGGDMQGLRDALEGRGKPDPSDPFGQREYKVNENVMQNVRNRAASMDNVDIKDNGKINLGSFIDEFGNARGRITKQDMKAFEKAGGDLSRLDRRLQKGGFTRNEVKAVEENLNKRGTAIKAGNEDYYTGAAGKNFLDQRLGRMIIDEPENPTEEIIEEIINDDGTPPPNEVGEGGTPDAGLDLGLKVEYGDLDPSSGFPFNPGRHDGKPFTNYKENISGIMDRTDERLEAIRENSPRTTPEDTLTYSYTQQLIDGGILPGSPGYVSAAEKDEARLEGDLAIKDAFSDDVMDQRRKQRAADLNMLRRKNEERRQDKNEELWGEGGSYETMRELQSKFMLKPEDYLPNTTPAPDDVIGTPPKEKEPKEPKEKGYQLDALPERPKGEPIKTPGLFNTVTTPGQKPPDDFKKKPAFDGSKNFDEFLARAQMGGDATKLYNALKNAGLSEEEMYKGAQYAGITNLRTSDSAIKDDIAAIKHAVDNNYYEGWGDEKTSEELKSERDLMGWYKRQGGEVPLKVLRRKAGYKSYDSKGDAESLLEAMQNQLSKAGIRNDPDPEAMKQFDKEMDALEEKFGGKFSFKTYEQALKDNSAADVNEWVTNYINLGGGVKRKVTDAVTATKKPKDNAKTGEPIIKYSGYTKNPNNITYFADGYGRALLNPDKKFNEPKFIDADRDRVDDRFQSAPGMPQFKGNFSIRDTRDARETFGSDQRKALTNYLQQLKDAGIELDSPVLERFKNLN